MTRNKREYSSYSFSNELFYANNGEKEILEFSPGYFGSLGTYSGVMFIYFALMYGIMIVKMFKKQNVIAFEKADNTGEHKQIAGYHFLLNFF
jgi:hypothetical protein